jgi:hypothetical protein
MTVPHPGFRRTDASPIFGLMRAAPRLFIAAILLPAALASGPALAQPSQGGPQMLRPQQQQAAPAPGLAPALPGLAGRRTPAPITGDPAANLSPNAGLFDAISRGDLAAARDAVTRGANLDARNALGLSPLDAAVDQGRNDIVFYLLSTRDLSRGPVTMEPSTASLGAPPAVAPRPAPRRETAAPAAPAAPRNARLWAGDGGAARPDAGFLGFDAGRPPGAGPSAPARPGRG